MNASTSPFPAALEQFVRLFNQEAFWESHEVLEDPWREHGSEFYHGLILYASAFVHLQRGNAHGVRAQLVKAERALQVFGPSYLGVDVASILGHAAVWRQAVEADPDETGGRWREAIRYPTIELQSAHLRGDEPERAGA